MKRAVLSFSIFVFGSLGVEASGCSSSSMAIGHDGDANDGGTGAVGKAYDAGSEIDAGADGSTTDSLDGGCPETSPTQCTDCIGAACTAPPGVAPPGRVLRRHDPYPFPAPVGGDAGDAGPFDAVHEQCARTAPRPLTAGSYTEPNTGTHGALARGLETRQLRTHRGNAEYADHVGARRVDRCRRRRRGAVHFGRLLRQRQSAAQRGD